MNEIKYWIGAAAAAVLLGLIPMTSSADEGFCEVVADAAQVAAKARDDGVLLGQYKSHIAQIAAGKPAAVDMHRLLDKVGTIVYTSEDFAGLTPDQAMRYAYRSCMSVK